MKILIKDGIIVNEGLSYFGSILISNDRIEKIIKESDFKDNNSYRDKINKILSDNKLEIIDASDLYILPGIIDTHVHFREPGDGTKGRIESESKAAVLGGVTSYFDMPNNNPSITSLKLLEEKYSFAEANSYANYSFYLGATNDNLEEILNLDNSKNCGVKLFMGSSTGNLLVDNEESLINLFQKCKSTISIHAEDNEEIIKNLRFYSANYRENIPPQAHPLIRSRTACIKATNKAIELAKRYDTRIHILHVSTKEEVELLRALYAKEPEYKRLVTAETCSHYLWFSSKDYTQLQSLIKCNPAIKEESDRDSIRAGVVDSLIKIISTDHAPHLLQDKEKCYKDAPGGIPLVQYSLLMNLELCNEGVFTLPQVVDRMAHSPAYIFKIKDRGYLKEGYFADITLVAKSQPTIPEPASLCGWSPFQFCKEKFKGFSHSVEYVFVNGSLVVNKGKFVNKKSAMRLNFNIK